ncbi:MAG: aliphatic sulfonate ABC transporter substrate-binding protein [Hyphomonadaceae bacterium]|nr:aliphatic sulfonate ABC transporter substrate-binding protein [Hyphomonadaceae bacterium]
MSDFIFSRRTALTLLGSSAALAACGQSSGAAGDKSVQLAFQKNGVMLVAQTRGSLVEPLKASGITPLEWVEFPSGPPLLEAMAVGAVDVGLTGDTPPIFVSSCRAPIKYVAQVRLSGKAGGVITPKNSGLQTLADIKGKKLCYTRGSSAHNSAVLALESVGLTINDVESVNLGPADAAAAFSQGGIDGWVIWDPYYTLAIRDQGARPLIGLDALGGGASFILANAKFVQDRPDDLKAILSAIAKEGQWCKDNNDEVARITAQASGLDLELLKDTMKRTDFLVEPLSDDVLAAQQANVDRFAALNVIPKSVKIADAAWRDWAG